MSRQTMGIREIRIIHENGVEAYIYAPYLYTMELSIRYIPKKLDWTEEKLDSNTHKP